MATTRTRKAGFTALLAVLTLVGAACGASEDSAGSDVGVASLTEDSADQTSANQTSAEQASADGEDSAGQDGDGGVEAPENIEDAMALFEDCMAEAGFDFGEFAGDSGGIAVETFGGSDDADGDPQVFSGDLEDFDPEVFNEASSACEGHLANATGGFDLSPEEQVKFEDAQREWSECMRENGVEIPEFDGSSGGAIAIEVGGEDGADPQGGVSLDDFGEEFEEANEACQSIFDELDETLAGDDR